MALLRLPPIALLHRAVIEGSVAAVAPRARETVPPAWRRPGGGFRRWTPLILPLVWLSAGGAPPGAQTPTEYDVKAAYIYNFVKFVEWPARSPGEARAPLVIGVLGEDPFEDSLERLVAGKEVGGRRIVVKRFADVEHVEPTPVLIVAGGAQRIREVLAVLGSAPVLTIGESPGFAEAGGIINFYVSGNKIRFEINQGAAHRVSLRISSKLLSLATLVGSRETSPPPHEEPR